METISTSVVRKVRHGNIIELRLKRPIGFNFTPGQCIDLHDESGNCRPYSLASGVKRDCLVLYIKYIPEGKLSSWADTLQTGMQVRISREPYGYFTPGETDRPFVFIATGTGVAPFISYIESHADLPKIYAAPPVSIILGCRYLEEAIDTSIITSFTKDYKFCITQDDITGFEDICFKGRVTEYVRDQWSPDVDAMYYLCGLDPMLSEMSELLCNAGVPVDNIMQEMFYFS